jgi:hypothetical protein
VTTGGRGEKFVMTSLDEVRFGEPPAPPQAPFSAAGPDLSGLGDLLNLSRQEALDALFDAALDSFDLALPDAAFGAPDQPRLPAGQPGGGEWTSGGGGAGAGDDRVARRAAGDARRARAAARQEAAEARYREKAAEVRAKVDPAHAAVVLDAVTQLLPKYFRRGRFGGADSDSVPEGALLDELDRRGLLDARRVYPAKVHQLLARMVFLGDLVRVEEGTGDVLSSRKNVSYALPRKVDAPFYSPDQPRVPAGQPGGGRWAGGVSPGTTAARDAASDAVRAFARGQGPPTREEAEALAGHLARLTVSQIHALKAEHGLRGSAPNKAALVAKMAERFRTWRAGRAPKEAVPNWPADYDVFGKRDVFADEPADAGTLAPTGAAVAPPGGKGTTPTGFLDRARQVLGEEEVRRLVHLPLAETHREYGRKHQAFRNEEAKAVADIIAARTVPGFNYGSVPRPRTVEPGEVKRVEAGPFNFILQRDTHGKHEVLVSSGGRFMDPKDARDRGLLDEAKAALGLPEGWIQGDPVPSPAAPPPPAPPPAPAIPDGPALEAGKLTQLTGVGGSVPVYRVDAGGRAYFVKQARGGPAGKPNPFLGNETAVADLARVAGVDAPAVRAVTFRGREALAAEWLSGKAVIDTPGGKAAVAALPPAEVARHLLFAFLADVDDRHLGNYVLSGGKLYSIDHEFAFESPDAETSAGRLAGGELFDAVGGPSGKTPGRGYHYPVPAAVARGLAAAAPGMAETLRARGMAPQADDVAARGRVLASLARDPSPTVGGLLRRLGWHMKEGYFP